MRLRGLAAFLPAFEAPDFTFAQWHPAASTTGTLTLGFFTLSTIARDFYQAAYELGWVLSAFDWGAWIGTDQARELMDRRDVLARATPKDMARLLTAIIRRDRFVEGALVEAFESGLLIAILRRAAVHLSEAP